MTFNQKAEKLMQIANAIAKISTGIEKKVFYFLLIGIAAAATIIWQWIDFGALSIGSFIKITLLTLPILLWFSLWSLIKQLTQLPENLAELKETGEESLSLVSNFNTEESSRKNIVSSLFNLIKTIREPEVFASILTCTKGLSLLANPLSLIALILSALCIIIFIFIALGFAIF